MSRTFKDLPVGVRARRHGERVTDTLFQEIYAERFRACSETVEALFFAHEIAQQERFTTVAAELGFTVTSVEQSGFLGILHPARLDVTLAQKGRETPHPKRPGSVLRAASDQTRALLTSPMPRDRFAVFPDNIRPLEGTHQRRRSLSVLSTDQYARVSTKRNLFVILTAVNSTEREITPDWSDEYEWPPMRRSAHRRSRALDRRRQKGRRS